MNKLILIIIWVSFMILGTGCQGVFDTIPKETVMVKQITRVNETNEVEYEGILSRDVVKTLSLNAVNKYFNKNSTMDEFQFELVVIDQTKFKDLLSEAEYAPKVKPELRLNDQTEFAPYSGGLYYTTLTKLTDPDEVYDIVLNARDGDVIKVARAGKLQNFASTREEDDLLLKYGKDKITSLAIKFIQDKGSYPLSDLSLNESITRSGGIAELYYMSKDSDKLKYAVAVNLRQNEVVGFSKDVMALLSYYSRL
ncbi:hypothetical protein [Paenibacillus sp. J22TS3]|uniref:hypothetical protein n=1 Tax=Paenibacillus sp. J22TS3 TaxID=2807192 RepID=UPI001B097AF7|nr:hypothetical protein [Paenibacillus sp. J22TS3]GIP22247.1 hypothetical protein J22TS3_25220 [Paenibacillus sp. J22TS3]